MVRITKSKHHNENLVYIKAECSDCGCIFCNNVYEKDRGPDFGIPNPIPYISSSVGIVKFCYNCGEAAEIINPEELL